MGPCREPAPRIYPSRCTVRCSQRSSCSPQTAELCGCLFPAGPKANMAVKGTYQCKPPAKHELTCPLPSLSRLPAAQSLDTCTGYTRVDMLSSSTYAPSCATLDRGPPLVALQPSAWPARTAGPRPPWARWRRASQSAPAPTPMLSTRLSSMCAFLIIPRPNPCCCIHRSCHQDVRRGTQQRPKTPNSDASLTHPHARSRRAGCQG